MQWYRLIVECQHFFPRILSNNEYTWIQFLIFIRAILSETSTVFIRSGRTTFATDHGISVFIITSTGRISAGCSSCTKFLSLRDTFGFFKETISNLKGFSRPMLISCFRTWIVINIITKATVSRKFTLN